MQLETPQLILRPWEEFDAPTLFHVATTPRPIDGCTRVHVTRLTRAEREARRTHPNAPGHS